MRVAVIINSQESGDCNITDITVNAASSNQSAVANAVADILLPHR
jgi:hypothetical protein